MNTSLYSYESNISASTADVFAYYKRPATLLRLVPPWEHFKILRQTGGIEDGGSVTLQVKIGPCNCIWKTIHQDYQENQQFSDVQVKGPFKYWKHTRSFRSMNANVTNLKDTIQFEIPFGQLGYQLGYSKIRERLNQVFTYRHTLTENDMKHWSVLKSFPKSKVVITGGNGLIGSELAVFLRAQGHDVLILSRSGKSKIFGVPGLRWDPKKRFLDSNLPNDIDCWIHLAGENLSTGRWTTGKIKRIHDSRVDGTRFLVDYLIGLKRPPKTFICASGVGFYGSGQDEKNESSAKGKGILADVCNAWEEASQGLEAHGIRRVILRTGMVLSYKGGALRKMLPIFKWGFGGTLGKGSQYWSWIAMDDLLQIYNTAIQDSQMSGIFNAVAPAAVSNRQFAKELGSTLNRPSFLRTPEIGLKSIFGPMADEVLLASQNVVPERLLEEQAFHFNFPELELALSHCLGTY